jgi:hypothetical protein
VSYANQCAFPNKTEFLALVGTRLFVSFWRRAFYGDSWRVTSLRRMQLHLFGFLTYRCLPVARNMGKFISFLFRSCRLFINRRRSFLFQAVEGFYMKASNLSVNRTCLRQAGYL